MFPSSFLHCSALVKFVNKAADGGITALHIASLNGYFDCVQLLLDLRASVSAVTFHYGTSMDLIGTFYEYRYCPHWTYFVYQFMLFYTHMFIGAGSTPLHYAACGGNLKCCQVNTVRLLSFQYLREVIVLRSLPTFGFLIFQILLARGASRLSLNCNG